MKLAVVPGSDAPRRSAVARRLLLAFGSNLALFAIALVVILRAMSQLDAADAEVGRFDHAKHAGHRVAALVREQYIHQAHTIIEGNRSHLDHYSSIAKATSDAVIAMRAVSDTPDDRSRASEIAALVRKNDEDFRAETLPAIEAGEVDKVRELHAATELVVVRALEAVEELNSRFEQRSEAAQARADRLRQRTRWTALLCFGLSALLVTITAVLTTRSISSRVAALRAAARELGRGDLKRRTRLAGTDEFAEIAHGIDEMAADLERHQEQILRANKLASIGQVAAGVAHEINNPLGVILGYVKTMRRTPARDDEGLDVIEEEANQCRRIVEGLLDLARPQELSSETFDLVELARDGVERLEASGALDGHEVSVRADATTVMVTADPGRLRQVLVNVLTNAAEATPSGGSIAVEIASNAGGSAVVTVRDSGTGIPGAVRARLFEPFVTTKRGGVGLGLAIAQSIMEAHRGRITCDVGGADGGAVVHIVLPAKHLGPSSVERT